MRVVAPPTPPPPTDEAVRPSDTAPGGSAAAEWPPWPATLLSEQDIIDRIALPALSEPRRQEAARSVRTVLAALRRAEGSCWQERWHNGGWNQTPDLAPLFGDSVRASAFKSGEIMHGLGVLLCLNIVRPSYDWLGRFRFTAGFERLRQVRGAEFFATVRDACQVRKVTRVQEQHAVRMLTIPLAHTGKSPRDLTSQDTSTCAVSCLPGEGSVRPASRWPGIFCGSSASCPQERRPCTMPSAGSGPTSPTWSTPTACPAPMSAT
ncbi:hypothetical protein ADK90_10415 [Streptomyces sp. XY413]|nr:hypothetical protein ADK90_10415 [Streptomyces sp. XY413]